MAIDYLIAALTPPLSALETPPPGAWASFERRLGTSLPRDYKEFIENYGSGRIGEFITIFNPFSVNDNVNLEKQIETQRSVLLELKTYGEAIRYEPFPAPSGVLPFGSSDNGDILYWKTVGNPDQWTVAISEGRAPEWEEFDSSMTRFITDTLLRIAASRIFPKDFPRAHSGFKPI